MCVGVCVCVCVSHRFTNCRPIQGARHLAKSVLGNLIVYSNILKKILQFSRTKWKIIHNTCQMFFCHCRCQDFCETVSCFKAALINVFIISKASNRCNVRELSTTLPSAPGSSSLLSFSSLFWFYGFNITRIPALCGPRDFCSPGPLTFEFDFIYSG